MDILNVIGAIENLVIISFTKPSDRMGIDMLDKYAKYFDLGHKTRNRITK